MSRKRVRVISQAHEWVQAQGLTEVYNKLDTLLQPDGRYVPTVATDDPFSGAEPCEFYVEATEDNDIGTALGNCDGIQFPDGSCVWWAEDFWSLTDPHGFDITQKWVLSEATRTHKRT